MTEQTKPCPVRMVRICPLYKGAYRFNKFLMKTEACRYEANPEECEIYREVKAALKEMLE